MSDYTKWGTYESPIYHLSLMSGWTLCGRFTKHMWNGEPPGGDTRRLCKHCAQKVALRDQLAKQGVVLP